MKDAQREKSVGNLDQWRGRCSGSGGGWLRGSQVVGGRDGRRGWGGGCLRDGRRHKPLCQAPGTTEAGTIQYAAKAFPGLRHLEVMRRIGPLAVPASICSREATDPDDPEFGYAPVAEAMLDRLRVTLE